IPPSWGAKLKTFMQMTVVGALMGYIALITTLEHLNPDALRMVEFDYRFYFGILIWATALITVWTGVDYAIKYSSMLKNALK
ncbi:MAG: hypothetical protein V3T31_02860, partial [candidate division Zixibacteria bacterium]